MNPLSIIGLGTGVIGSIGKMFGRGTANRRLNDLLRQDPTYQENPLVAQRVGLARTLLNARMPSAAAQERNIYSNQANTVSNIERSATSANDLLLGGANTQGLTNKAFDTLGQEENADYQRREGNYDAANNALVEEQQRVFNDKVRKFQNMAQIKGAMVENNQNTWGDFSNLGFGLASFGLNSGMKDGSNNRTTPTRF